MDAIDRYLAWKRGYDKSRGLTVRDACLPRASAALVDWAEDELGVTFPPSYRKLVTSTCLHDGDEFLWPTRKKDEPFSIVHNRTALPSFLLAFFRYGGGDEACFDMRNAEHGDEFPIVLWNHEVDNDDPDVEYEVLAENLGEYLLRYRTRVPGYRPESEPPA